MKPDEIKERTRELKSTIKTILNEFVVETSLTVTGVDIKGIVMDYGKGYGLIDDMSIEIKI